MGDVYTLYSAAGLGGAVARQVKVSPFGNEETRRSALQAENASGAAQSPDAAAKGAQPQSAKAASAYLPDAAGRGKEQEGEGYSELEDSLASHGLKLKFKVDEKTDILQVEVLDSTTGKTVRKLPPDNLLQLTASIKELSRGLLDSSF
ncbi:MAG: flagellar protein FlaG [Desulfovibrio sp.]|uniref:flagellar protein FlaG n=1 Tax=Desulfovibrio sp. 7SRBS1 TaxID=3378064 RepID=UPI003B425C62